MGYIKLCEQAKETIRNTKIMAFYAYKTWRALVAIMTDEEG